MENINIISLLCIHLTDIMCCCCV